MTTYQPTSDVPTSADNLTDRHHRIGIDVLSHALFLAKAENVMQRSFS